MSRQKSEFADAEQLVDARAPGLLLPVTLSSIVGLASLNFASMLHTHRAPPRWVSHFLAPLSGPNGTCLSWVDIVRMHSGAERHRALFLRCRQAQEEV